MAVLTRVTAAVDPGRADDLVAAYRELLTQPFPDGLEQTMLLRGDRDEWQVITVWRDRAALDAMRAQPEPPAAVTLFRQFDSTPAVAIFEIAAAS